VNTGSHLGVLAISLFFNIKTFEIKYFKEKNRRKFIGKEEMYF